MDDAHRRASALASIEHVMLEDRDAVLLAIDALDKRFDFAAALHAARGSAPT